MKSIGIFGSTGSIGTQTIDVLSAQSDKFKLDFITANNNAELLIAQAIEHKPSAVCICNESLYTTVKKALSSYPIQVFAGKEELMSLAAWPTTDMVLTALVGFAGLPSTIKAIETKKQIALANKETLVVAGDIITRLAQEHGVSILPVDSEHSAIFQCLVGEADMCVEKIILTASGGPFKGMQRDQLLNVTKREALKHPNWEMGAKITIDSASMMNKGLEVIEAKWLFNLEPEQIEVIIHPQSIIHSLVQFKDSSIKAQLGLPDMKLPIHYALNYPHRSVSNIPRFDFSAYPQLNFEKPDPITFKNLAIAYNAISKGGNMPCAMNAANEIVVEAFLCDKIGFLAMSDIIQETMDGIQHIEKPTLADYIATDQEARRIAAKLLHNS